MALGTDTSTSSVIPGPPILTWSTTSWKWVKGKVEITQVSGLSYRVQIIHHRHLKRWLHDVHSFYSFMKSIVYHCFTASMYVLCNNQKSSVQASCISSHPSSFMHSLSQLAPLKPLAQSHVQVPTSSTPSFWHVRMQAVNERWGQIGNTKLFFLHNQLTQWVHALHSF